MSICLNLHFLSEIKSGDLLTFLALLLAYIAYTWSVNKSLEAWKSLFVSFKTDLNSQKAWLANEYFKETYKDKNSFSPCKIIFPLSFESLPEIIKRGASEFSWLSSEFIDRLSLFNERVVAFNDLLDYIRKSITADPIVSERLKDKLNNLGLDENKVEFDELEKKILKAKKTDTDFYLAEQIRKLNIVVHVSMIGNKSMEDKLHHLYFEINSELDDILNNFDKKKPFFIKYKWLIILFSIVLFTLIEVFLK